ncbi:hypothetical protein IHE45_14G094700 [Dioscorea alata]|uniref:Uncharacterized protein n=1 Tax=Dioscorea alata TaxID=55571 RepID=A0ACB7UTS5_DIOAL|nr:hypothetical protein IHE45_14G094700 [Dioscorea alata]
MVPSPNLLLQHIKNHENYSNHFHLRSIPMIDEMATSREGEEELRHGKGQVRTSFIQETDHEDKNWLQLSIGGSASTSSQPLRTPLGFGFFSNNSMISISLQDDYRGSRSSRVSLAHVRVVSPPRRPPAGLWFILRASQIQRRGHLLPQLPKSYLRIRDGSMTVRLLMKYLVSKLQLEHESEVQITCRGQELHPILTLQHVRDQIWWPYIQDSLAIDHVMTLQYSRKM